MRRRIRLLVGLYALLQSVNRKFIWVAVCLGFCLPLLLQAVLGTWIEPSERAGLMLANLIIAVAMLSFRKAGIVLTADRLFGVRDLLATAGVTRNDYLLAYLLDAVTLSAIPIGAALVAAATMKVAPPTSWAWLVPYTVSAIMLFAAGVLISACVRSIPPAVLAVDLGLMGSLALCPIAYPPDRVPLLIRPLISLSPPTLAAKAIGASWNGGQVFGTSMLLLCSWTMLLAFAAWQSFPWTNDI